jgi:UDP-N-acetylglucosamine:LPS N-acetylglucosamine transferase
MLAKGYTLGSAQGLKFMQGVVRLYHGSTTKLLSRHWLESKPDMVVSLVPNFNRTLYQGLRNVLPKVPYVTILTDFADYPPHFWMERQEQYFICGTEKAVEQARALGHAEGRIFRVSGMILRPTFYEPVTVDRCAERVRLGLDPDKPTGLVLFGGQGSRVMLDIDRLLDDVQLIFVCGKNLTLAQKLRDRRASAGRFIEGFTPAIPYYMHLSDFFIGKPGPGSISEAVAMKLPVIVERNLWTLPQERYNADWVLEQGVGFVLPNFRGVRNAVADLLGSLDQYRAHVEKIENRAVFEIIDILKSIAA